MRQAAGRPLTRNKPNQTLADLRNCLIKCDHFCQELRFYSRLLTLNNLSKNYLLLRVDYGFRSGGYAGSGLGN